MEHVQDVVVRQGPQQAVAQVAVVFRRADHDDGVRYVFTDHGDHPVAVGGHVAPVGGAVGLVANLEEEIGTVAVLGGDLPEEADGRVSVFVGVRVVQDMPVHQNIQVGFDGSFDTFLY